MTVSADTAIPSSAKIMLYRQIAKVEAVPPLVQELLSRQRDDGGWSQTKKLKSDALGTGQALVALSSAVISATHPVVERARRFLLRSQCADGTWFVASRAYQAPEFSSYMGAAWATLALLRTLPD
jgi:squalene cyclase